MKLGQVDVRHAHTNKNSSNESLHELGIAHSKAFTKELVGAVRSRQRWT